MDVLKTNAHASDRDGAMYLLNMHEHEEILDIRRKPRHFLEPPPVSGSEIFLSSSSLFLEHSAWLAERARDRFLERMPLLSVLIKWNLIKFRLTLEGRKPTSALSTRVAAAAVRGGVGGGRGGFSLPST